MVNQLESKKQENKNVKTGPWRAGNGFSLRGLRTINISNDRFLLAWATRTLYLAATKHLFDCLSAETMEIGSLFRKKKRVGVIKQRRHCLEKPREHTKVVLVPCMRAYGPFFVCATIIMPWWTGFLFRWRDAMFNPVLACLSCVASICKDSYVRTDATYHIYTVVYNNAVLPDKRHC